jgi:hypothetical protein
MIELIENMPDHVAAFRASGKVDKQDYEKIVFPVVDDKAKRFGKLNFLLELETPVANYTIGAWIDDALVGLKHFTQWHKIAIISDQKMVAKITDILGHFIPGKAKGFLISELAEAKKWVTEP